MLTFEEFKKILNLSNESGLCSTIYELYCECQRLENKNTNEKKDET